MREPDRDLSRLQHILSAIECVETYVKDVNEAELENNKLHLHATIYNVQIIGEAAYKLTHDFKQAHPETPWELIEKMRHILVHDYFKINSAVLWDVVTNDIPKLKSQVEKYIEEF